MTHSAKGSRSAVRKTLYGQGSGQCFQDQIADFQAVTQQLFKTNTKAGTQDEILF